MAIKIPTLMPKARQGWGTHSNDQLLAACAPAEGGSGGGAGRS